MGSQENVLMWQTVLKSLDHVLSILPRFYHILSKWEVYWISQGRHGSMGTQSLCNNTHPRLLDPRGTLSGYSDPPPADQRWSATPLPRTSGKGWPLGFTLCNIVHLWQSTPCAE